MATKRVSSSTEVVRTGMRYKDAKKKRKIMGGQFDASIHVKGTKKATGSVGGAKMYSQNAHTVHLIGGKGVKTYKKGNKTPLSEPKLAGQKTLNPHFVRTSTQHHEVSARKAGAIAGATAVVGGAAAYKGHQAYRKKNPKKAVKPSQKALTKARVGAAVTTGGAIGMMTARTPKGLAYSTGAAAAGSVANTHYLKKHESLQRSERRAVNKNPKTPAKVATHSAQKHGSRVVKK